MNRYQYTSISFFLAIVSLAVIFVLSVTFVGPKEPIDSSGKDERNSQPSYIVYDESTQLDITSPELSKMVPSSDRYESWLRHLSAMCGINRACQKAVKEHLPACVDSAPRFDKASKLNHLIECVSDRGKFPRSRLLKGWVGASKAKER